MPIDLPAHERPKLKALLETAGKNLRALELFSRYLNLCPRFVTGKDAALLCRECHIAQEEAYRLLVASACGVDLDSGGDMRELAEQYFRPAIRRMDARACREDPYYAAVHMPETARGGWKLGYKRIEPFEAFVRDELLLFPDGREVPRVGYFTEPFLTPVVMENGREWMTVSPSELNTMAADIRAVKGKVAVFGLGLGYFAFMAARKPEVTRVTVIERDKSVIELFQEHILPVFEDPFKVTVAHSDAYEFAAHMAGERYDFAYVDLWHDVLDGVEMYLRMKRLESLSPHTRFLYWIETSMLCWLRGVTLVEVAEERDGPMLETIGQIRRFKELERAISQDGLRNLAPRVPLEVARRG